MRNVNPTEIRWQNRKPSLGGIVFYNAFLLYIVYALIYDVEIEMIDKSQLFFIFIALSIAFFSGLIDDAKNTNPLLKFLSQMTVGGIIAASGIIIPLSDNVIWDSVLTIMWFIFLMNSINMLDNIDGATGILSVYMISCMIVFVFWQNDISIFYSHMALAVLASIVAFLYYNWSPSKIYMGDNGSQFLGAFLSLMSIISIWNFKSPSSGIFQVSQIFYPFFVFSIPIFDTSTVFFHRIRRGTSPLVGGKDHLAHSLVFLGLKDWQSVSVLALIQFFFCSLALYVYHYLSHIPFIHISLSVLWILTFLILQYLYFRSTQKMN